MDDLWGASLESSVTSCGRDRGQEGKELTKKCLENTCRVNNFVVCIYIFFKPVCSRKSFAEHAGLFSASPLRIHALAQVSPGSCPGHPRSSAGLYITVLWLPCSRAHCQRVLREDRFTFTCPYFRSWLEKFKTTACWLKSFLHHHHFMSE